MEINFYGPWKLEVKGKNAQNIQRILFIGTSMPIPPQTIRDDYNVIIDRIDGTGINKQWKIKLESFSGMNWLPSDVKIKTEYNGDIGLIKYLKVDDAIQTTSGTIRDEDYDDLIIKMTYLREDLTPFRGKSSQFEFTFPKEFLKKKNPK